MAQLKCCLLAVIIVMLAVSPHCLADSPPQATLIVVVDVSASMDDRFPTSTHGVSTTTTKLIEVKRRLTQLVEKLPQDTRMVLTVFDHAVRQMGDLVVHSDDVRRQAIQRIGQIKTQNGSTHLWRAIDSTLAQTADIVKQNPEHHVRVLLYSDGQDMEGDPNFSYESLLRKYGALLNSSVSLDWVAIGYDLKPEVQTRLEKAGVRFAKGESAESIIPIRAGFRLSSSAIKPGDEVTLVDTSLGLEIQERWVDWGDKSPFERGEAFKHIFQQPGEYLIRYVIQDRAGKKSTNSARLTVLMPPPLAAFKVSGSIHRPGDAIQLINESNGSAVRWQWSVDDKVFSNDRNPVYRAVSPGEVTVQLTVWDRDERSHSCQQKITIRAIQPPTANFTLPSTAQPEQEVSLVDQSTGEIQGNGEWIVDGQAVHEGATTSFKAVAGARHKVKRVVRGPGGKDECLRTVQVDRYPAPQAGFTLGVDRATVGDSVRVTSSHHGKIQRVEFFVDDARQPIVLDDNQLSFELPCDHAGAISIRQVVSGPGGSNTLTQFLNVKPRGVAPASQFEVELVQREEDGSILVRFVNRSSGNIGRLEFDPDDGSPVEVGGADACFEQLYAAGQSYFPAITARSPDHDGFPPSIWRSDRIHVATPWPAWLKNLFWQIPVGVLSACFIALVAVRQSRRARRKRWLLLNGHLAVLPSQFSRDGQNFYFERRKPKEIVDLEGGDRLAIETELLGGDITYNLVLYRDGKEMQSTTVSEDQIARLGGYAVRYTA